MMDTQQSVIIKHTHTLELSNTNKRSSIKTKETVEKEPDTTVTMDKDSSDLSSVPLHGWRVGGGRGQAFGRGQGGV